MEFDSFFGSAERQLTKNSGTDRKIIHSCLDECAAGIHAVVRCVFIAYWRNLKNRIPQKNFCYLFLRSVILRVYLDKDVWSFKKSQFFQAKKFFI